MSHCPTPRENELTITPNTGFEDPFDSLQTVTLDNKDYRFLGISLMSGKLDWMLLRRCIVRTKSVGNHNYIASDHKWLMTEIILG